MLRFITRIISSIEKKNISKDKLKKYLIFSIGEIILIVISLLLANQVNIKNEERITRKKEIEYLSSLSNELQNNLLEIDEKIILVDTIRCTLKHILAYTNNIDTLSEIQFNNMLQKVVKQTPILNHESGVIENVIHSGDLNIISKTELKTYLASWESWMKRVNRQEIIVSNYRDNIKEILIKNGSVVTLIDKTNISKNVNLSFKLKILKKP
jgi:hypothetical protein